MQCKENANHKWHQLSPAALHCTYSMLELCTDEKLMIPNQYLLPHIASGHIHNTALVLSIKLIFYIRYGCYLCLSIVLSIKLIHILKYMAMPS